MTPPRPIPSPDVKIAVHTEVGVAGRNGFLLHSFGPRLRRASQFLAQLRFTRTCSAEIGHQGRPASAQARSRWKMTA